MLLQGTPSDQLPGVIATGETDVTFAFISLSSREPTGRDAEYIEWHSLDHRPEQHRLPQLRSSLRLVSTAACRDARAASTGAYDAVDHVMTYLFTGRDGLDGFNALGAALNVAGRMPLRLPSVGYLTADLAGKAAAPAAVAGADVLPWRPVLGVYLIVEKGQASPQALLDEPGVAGVWWYHGGVAPAPYQSDSSGLQITYCYLDRDPVEVGKRLGQRMLRRWAGGAGVGGLLAAPFHAVVPFEWARHLPE